VSPPLPSAPTGTGGGRGGEFGAGRSGRGTRAREVEAGVFDVEDGPVVATAEEEGELVAPELEREMEGAVANELR
jgi:hypothetical protein